MSEGSTSSQEELFKRMTDVLKNKPQFPGDINTNQIIVEDCRDVYESRPYSVEETQELNINPNTIIREENN